MSGICGICEPGTEVSARELAPMLDALALAGEMGRAKQGGPSAGLAVAQRWEFQQLATVGHVSVAADADLLDSGEPTAVETRSTAERIARLYVEHGAAFVEHLHGAFACVVWDADARLLLLAIDRMGIKSLYWRREGDRLLFASRLGAIRAAQREPVEVNPAAVLQFTLFSAVPAPLTMDKGTEKLRPGTLLTFADGTVNEKQYWDLEYP
ncbi:MAG TPA: hypothetical protein VEH49_07485, partial [Methylomirabilota bacterium]|nr:hypothetical protein [Methylomirabilota bacterium]